MLPPLLYAAAIQVNEPTELTQVTLIGTTCTRALLAAHETPAAAAATGSAQNPPGEMPSDKISLFYERFYQ